MDSIMFSKVLREFTIGPLNQLVVNLGGQDGDQWEQQLKQFLRKEPCWTNGQVTQVAEPKSTPSILELVEFNPKRNALVDISQFYFGDKFKELFPSTNNKTDYLFSEEFLHNEKFLYHRLRQSSLDGPIITELGGEAKAETTLSEMFSLISITEKHREDMILLKGGRSSNIFYIRDGVGVLRTVSVGWFADGWDINASFVENPRMWRDGSHVFSRHSIPA